MEYEIDHGDWFGLPICLLEMVSDRLTLSADYIRFASVCTSWRSVFEGNNNDFRPSRQLPMLIIPHVVDEESLDEKGNKRMMKNKRSLYSLSDKQVYNNFMISVPDTVYCLGSDYGWLVTVDMKDKDYPVTLLNPFLPTNNEIALPSLHASPIYPEHPDVIDRFNHAEKFVLSANPTTSSDYTVMAITGGSNKLMMWKPKYKVWKFVVSHEDPCLHNVAMKAQYMDIIYSKGRFYAVNQRGQVVVCDVANPENIKVETFALAPKGSRLGPVANQYIVESSGELYQLHRERDSFYINGGQEDDDDGSYSTHNFQVFKLVEYDGSDGKEKRRNWVEVNTLGGHAFFVGHNTSFSILASEFPGCKPNCIYFTDDNAVMFIECGNVHCNLGPIYTNLGPHDIGIFNIEDRSVEQHYSPPESIRQHIWPNPVWIEPSVYQKSIN